MGEQVGDRFLTKLFREVMVLFCMHQRQRTNYLGLGEKQVSI
jgi:hypothetical protein